MYDVVALGELLIDFTPQGESDAGMRLFEQNPGGAPANVLCALSNLGASTAFIGKVGKDMHGDFLRDTLTGKKVDVSGLVQTPDVFTTLAFVALSDAGERSFSFARKPGADTCLTQRELREDIIRSTRVFHFGSLSLTDDPSRSATLAAIDMAKEAGAIISYDPNYRAPLWRSRDEAIAQMRSVLDKVDVIKISDEESELLAEKSTPEEAAKALLDKGIACAVVTLGKEGALVTTRSASVRVPAPDGKVVDTTGAGDSFWGGFLYKLVSSGTHPKELQKEQQRDFALFANSVATLCIQKRGAIPAMPTMEEAMVLYNQIKDK